MSSLRRSATGAAMTAAAALLFISLASGVAAGDLLSDGDRTALKIAGTIGSGDERIHVIPALSRPSLKNGDTLTIRAVVKASAGVASVTADVGGLGTIALTPDPTQATPSGDLALYTGTWTGHGLEERIYTVALTVTDRTGHAYTDRSLRFSDPIAGNDVRGTTDYPNGGLTRVDSTVMAPFEEIECVAVDVAGRQAYFGTDSVPGRIVRVQFSTGPGNPSVVDSITLPAGETNLQTAVIDTTSGFAYFGTDTIPGRVVKVRAQAGQPLARVGAVTLGAGENNLKSSVIDPSRGVALFGTDTSPGRVVKVALGAGSASPTRVGGLFLNDGEEELYGAAIDTAAGHAFFGTKTTPARVVKVAIGAASSGPARLASLTLPTGENEILAGARDSASGTMYFTTASRHLVAVTGGAGTAAPTRTGSVALLAGETDPRGLAVLGGSIYVGTRGVGGAAGTLVKFLVGTPPAPPTRVGALQASNGASRIRAIALAGATGNDILFATSSGGEAVIQASSSGAAIPLQTGVLTFGEPGEEEIEVAVVDTTNRYAYLGTETVPGRVIKVALGDGASAPRRVGSIALATGEDNIESAVIDPGAGFAYFGTDTAPGRVVKVALGAGDALPSRVGTLTLNVGEDELKSAIIDPASGFAWFGTHTNPGRVVKVALGAGSALPTRVGAGTCAAGEEKLISAVIDPANRHGFFGTRTQPGQVVKFDLGVGSASPSRLGAVSFVSGEDDPETAAIDTTRGVAYFGTDTRPGIVVKIALGAGTAAPTRVGAATLQSGEGRLFASAMDVSPNELYVATDESPGAIVRLSGGAPTAAPTRLDATPLADGEEDIVALVLDPVFGNLIAGSFTVPGTVTTIATSQRGFLKGTRMTMPEDGEINDVRFFVEDACGNVRLSIYDDSGSRNKLWESNSFAPSASGAVATVPITNGSPQRLRLPAGTYHLCWQTDCTDDVPSFSDTAQTDDSFYYPQAFGSSPATLSSDKALGTTGRFTQYLSYTALPVTSERLENISTRGQSQSGDNIVIAGFIIDGTAPKTVLVTGWGPGLAGFNVPNRITTPRLRLFAQNGPTFLTEATGWAAGPQAAEIAATGNQPPSNEDAAMIVTLPPGAYTAQLTDAGGGQGNGLVEVYDIQGNSFLTNISTRGPVGTGDNIMIAGFIVETLPGRAGVASTRRILVTGWGQGLAGFGVPGTLPNARLRVFNASATMIAENEDWDSSAQAGLIAATGKQPPAATDAAVILDLAPGSYTAHLLDIAGRTGNGLVEVFDLGPTPAPVLTAEPAPTPVAAPVPDTRRATVDERVAATDPRVLTRPAPTPTPTPTPIPPIVQRQR